MLENMLAEMNYSLAEGKQEKGIICLSEANCNSTIEKGIIHIYRPPNIKGDITKDTWGGFKIFNENNRFSLKENHTYIILFDIKGKSSNTNSRNSWTNYCGWESSELNPDPTNVKETSWISENFNKINYITVYYKWTISDTLNKICTEPYSSYEKGKSYLSYRDFQWIWSYTNTGSVGTDMYVRNFRMYDITNLTKEDVKFLKTGNIEATLFSDDHEKMSIGKYGEINTNNIIEN